MKKLMILLAIGSITMLSCSKEEESSSCVAADRTGAVCNDGTSSSATGSGACSGHGGVDYWKCN